MARASNLTSVNSSDDFLIRSERVSLGLSKTTMERYLVAATCFFFLLNASKPFADIFLGLSNQIITAVQLVFLLAAFLYFLMYQERSIGLTTFAVLFYFLARYLIEIVLLVVTEFKIEFFIAATYSVVRIFMFFLFLHVLSTKLSKRTVNYLLLIFLSYFIFTVFITVLQHPLLLDLEIFRSSGGNIVSGNGLGIFRATGGIGGTVIGYANYLLAVFWLLYFLESYRVRHHKILIIALVFSLLACFSRSLFLAIFLIMIIQAISQPKWRHLVIVFGIASTLPFIDFQAMLDVYRDMIRFSDEARLQQWGLVTANLDMLTFLLGNQVGENTGLHTSGMRTISGDSFLLGTLNDFGFIGLILFLTATAASVNVFERRISIYFGLISSLFLMLMVNSGFLKLTVMFSYVLALTLLSNLSGRFARCA